MTSTTQRHVAARGLGPADVAAYAALPGTSGIEVDLGAYDGDALEPVRRARADLDAARAEGAVYGLTTGVGRAASRPYRSRGLPTPTAMRSDCGAATPAAFGPEVSDEVARGTMLVRLHQLLRGGSGVDPALVQALAAALVHDAVPRLHTYGGIGTGDLTALSELGLTLAGELPWRRGSSVAAPVADGDALPFASSNALTVAVGSIAVTGLAALARAAEQTAALSHLALRGSLQAYDPRVHAAKDDPYAVAVAARLTSLLTGPPRESARLQDPFGLRTVPQVHGPLGGGARAPRTGRSPPRSVRPRRTRSSSTGRRCTTASS